MTEEEMWQAVLHNDQDYDGLFFYAVKTTGIYCRPSCKSKAPKRENICFFPTAAKAKAAGFRPCKRCRSDLLDYEPMQEIADALKKKLEKVYGEQEALLKTAGEIGLTERRLTDIFKEAYGLTPKAYVDKLRLEEAKRALAQTDRKVIDIAYTVGFASLSGFYIFFKKETGLTPLGYRKSQQALKGGKRSRNGI